MSTDDIKIHCIVLAFFRQFRNYVWTMDRMDLLANRLTYSYYLVFVTFLKNLCYVDYVMTA